MTELLRRGYIAALAPQGVPNADTCRESLDSRGVLRWLCVTIKSQEQENSQRARQLLCLADIMD